VVSELRNCAFANVRLPIAVSSGKEEEEARKVETKKKKTPWVTIKREEAGKVARWIEEKLVFEEGTFVSTFAHGDWLWCRISGQVYVEVNDFEWLAECLRDICAEVKFGNWRA
jgi:hypothetical protein